MDYGQLLRERIMKMGTDYKFINDIMESGMPNWSSLGISTSDTRGILSIYKTLSRMYEALEIYNGLFDEERSRNLQREVEKSIGNLEDKIVLRIHGRV